MGVSSLTHDLLLVRIQLDFSEGFYQHLDEDQAILVAASDALHEAAIANTLLIVYIAQLWGVDARRANRGRRERETLAHGRSARGKPGERWLIAIGRRGMATQPSFCAA